MDEANMLSGDIAFGLCHLLSWALRPLCRGLLGTGRNPNRINLKGGSKTVGNWG